MKRAYEIINQLNWLSSTATFFRQHFIAVLGLGLIAALGRVIQLGAFGTISSSLHFTLEIIVELSRVFIFTYVLGLANSKKGAWRLLHFITRKKNRQLNWKIAWHKLKHQWVFVLLNITGFLLIAWVINYLIDALAYETCLFITLQKNGLLADAASEWTIILFFKNLSVIPFTLIFNALFWLWITDHLKNLTPDKSPVA